MTMIEQLPRTFDLLTKLEEKFPEKDDMLCRKVHGKWIKHSVKDYVRRSHLIAYALVHYGYGKDDKAITICSNRPEWNFLDMGLNIAHMIHVPVYPTLGNDDFLHIFNHSDAKIIFVGSESQLKKLSPIIERMDTPARVILMDDSDTHECLRDL